MSGLIHLECARCGKHRDAGRLQQRCGCGGTLLARYDLEGVSLARLRSRAGGTWRYRELLPVEGDPVSLGEPETPLVPAPRLSERWGAEVFIKDDSPLAGGTFKARGAAVALSRALELGVTRIVMPSAGNAGGAWALYAARAGIELTVTMAASAPRANQIEVLAAGARLILIEGTIADAAGTAVEIAEREGIFLAATFSEPYRLEGKKACWLEVFDGLGDEEGMRLPRTIVLPVGGGVAAVAATKAVAEVAALGWTQDPPPKLIGAQAELCAPLARAFARGDRDAVPWDGEGLTIAAGLRVPAPAEGALVLERIRASRGAMLAVSEGEIVAGVNLLAAAEGVFACPEGATAVAAAQRLANAGELEGPVVIYNTGAGAKYADELAARIGS